MTSIGQNVWFDLMSTDPDGARAFYTDLIGWTCVPFENASPDMPYEVWMAGETGIGGLMKLPDAAQQMGAPSHWIAYTKVADVAATVAQANELGATVLQPPFQIPTVGHVSVLADPQGAVFAVFQPEGEASGTKGDKVGEFSWTDLNTRDYKSAWTFYSALFGWKHRSTMDMGPAGEYFMFEDPEGITKGGMSNAANAMNMPAHWIHYITVDSVDTMVERITAAGGKVLNGPMDIPGDDRIAHCADPQGAVFAIYSSGKK